MKNYPHTISKLARLFGVKDKISMDEALGIPRGTGSKIEYGTAGNSVQTGYKLALKLAKHIPKWKRKRILKEFSESCQKSCQK